MFVVPSIRLLMASCLLVGFLTLASCSELQTREVTVAISNAHPRVAIEPTPRKMSITLRMPIDSSGSYIVPKSLDSALDLLSHALPKDFRSALLRDDDMFMYANSDYGESVVEDAGEVIAAAWGLSDDNEVCRHAYELMRPYSPGSCFTNLLFLYKVRNQPSFKGA